MLETISIIVGIASGILSSIQAVKSFNGNKKEEVKIFLTEIADTLKEAVDKFKQDEVPHGACERMRLYAIALPVKLDGYVDADTLRTYSWELFSAHEIEKLLMTVRQHPESLAELEKAEGMFRAASNLL